MSFDAFDLRVDHDHPATPLPAGKFYGRITETQAGNLQSFDNLASKFGLGVGQLEVMEYEQAGSLHHYRVDFSPDCSQESHGAVIETRATGRIASVLGRFVTKVTGCDLLPTVRATLSFDEPIPASVARLHLPAPRQAEGPVQQSVKH